MKSRRHNQSAKRSRWAHVNNPDGWRRRRAAMDARRESIAATLPPADAGPQPGEAWQTVLVLGANGDVMHRLSLYVPTSGRCDQHAADVDGQRLLMTATQIGRSVAGMICKRPTLAQTAEARRDQWRAACDIEADLPA